MHKAELIEQKSTLTLRTVSKTLPWPSVVRLKKYVKVPYANINLTRKNILRRDKHKCNYCGRGDLPLTIDHIIPKSKGGIDSWTNLTAACLICNNKKGNRTPEEANMPLKNKPYKPNYIMFILNSVSRVDEVWKKYLFLK